MRSWSRGLGRGVGAAAVLLGVLAGGVLAQDAASPALPITPDPSKCTVAPASREEVRAIWQEVNAAAPSASVAPVPVDIPGTPADDETIAAATSLLVEVIRCSANANSGLADATFLTDAHLRDNLRGMSEEDFDAFYTETPVASVPEDWLMVYAIHDVRMLEDGRIAVNPEIIVPGVGRFRDLLLLAQVDGRWLIDLSQEGDGNLYP